LIIPDQALIESLFDAPDSSSNRWKHLFRIGVPHILFKVKPDPINLGELCWTLPAAAAKLFPAGYCERIAFFYEEPAAASAVGRCIYHSWSSGQIRLNPIPLKVSQCVFEGQFLGAAFLVNHFRIGPRTFPLQSTHTFTAGGKRLTLHAGPQLEAGEFWLEPSGGHGFQKWAVNTTHPYFEAFEGKMRFRTSRMTANPRTGGAQARRFRELRDLWTREKLV
jgi:hypothetical protein